MTIEHKPIQQRYKDDMARLDMENDIEVIKSVKKDVSETDTSNERRQSGAKLNINVDAIEPTTKQSKSNSKDDDKVSVYSRASKISRVSKVSAARGLKKLTSTSPEMILGAALNNDKLRSKKSKETVKVSQQEITKIQNLIQEMEAEI